MASNCRLVAFRHSRDDRDGQKKEKDSIPVDGIRSAGIREEEMNEIKYRPIGTIYTPFNELEGMPIQPSGAEKVRGRIELLEEFADPTALPMLIPAAIVFIVAVSGRHFLAALTAGIIAAIIIGPLTGVFSLEVVFNFTSDGSVGGSAVDGAIGLLPTSILTLLLVTSIGIMKAGGFLDLLITWLEKVIAKFRANIY